MAAIHHIHQRLDELNKDSKAFTYDTQSSKWIVFSDHHRGVGDGADDFAPCKEQYLSALEFYLERDFGLIILGDAEEFWENTLKNVITKYADVLDKEKAFHNAGKLIKIWGNHDDAWNHLSTISTHLFPFFNNIKTHEAIRFTVKHNKDNLGQILFVHGHQGSSASDRFAGISRWFVRVIWRNFQRVFKFPLSTPATSKLLKDAHDIAMHSWAKNQANQIVVCGHTHQPVFMSRNHIDVLESELEGMDHDDERNFERIREIQQRLIFLRQKTTAIGTLVHDKHPCYFNSGCCSYADGDITGIEMEEEQIRLVKWNKNGRKVIEEENLLEIYKLL